MGVSQIWTWRLQVLSGTYPEDMAGYLFLVHPQTHHQGPPVVSGEGVLRSDRI